MIIWVEPTHYCILLPELKLVYKASRERRTPILEETKKSGPCQELREITMDEVAASPASHQ